MRMFLFHKRDTKTRRSFESSKPSPGTLYWIGDASFLGRASPIRCHRTGLGIRDTLYVLRRWEEQNMPINSAATNTDEVPRFSWSLWWGGKVVWNIFASYLVQGCSRACCSFYVRENFASRYTLVQCILITIWRTNKFPCFCNIISNCRNRMQ